MVKLAMLAVKEIGWNLTSADMNTGLVTFQTSISWGSWNGVSGSISIIEIQTGRFQVHGTGKQNVRGAQLLALNMGREAQRKAERVIAVVDSSQQVSRAPLRLRSRRNGTRTPADTSSATGTAKVGHSTCPTAESSALTSSVELFGSLSATSSASGRLDRRREHPTVHPSDSQRRH